MIKNIAVGLLVVVFILLFPSVVCAQNDDSTHIEEQLDLLDTNAIENAIRQSEFVGTKNINLNELIKKAVRGELNLSAGEISNYLLTNLFSELSSMLNLMRNMILIALIGAIFKNLSQSFKQKEVSEIGYYVTYLVVTILLFSSLRICAGVAYGLITELYNLMEASIPVMIALMYLSGKPAGAYMINPVLMFINGFITRFIRDFLLVVITAAAGLELVNHISEKSPLSKLSEGVRKTIAYTMKGSAVLFIAILSLQSLSAPIITNGVTKTAKAAINIVPIVGQALSGAIDAVSAWSGAVKSGTMIALIIVIVIFCAAPLIKLLAFIVIFKLTAALIQPVSDPRIVKAIDSIGGYAALFLGAGVFVSLIFVFAAMITLTL